MAFKDYEYGLYGFITTYRGIYMDSQYCHNQTTASKRNLTANGYRQGYDSVFKQLPKLKSVIFIYGDYKEVI